ncbi:MAG: potassium channel family protein [Microbacteriaceae bacterium]|nr:potassium channel family protein [Microbacteriaceae bacterium]MCL2795617.1 potassium channel family protein [Microbacteriaceae bacterium]
MTQDRWRKWTEWPLVGLAVVFLISYSWEVIGDLHGPARHIAEVVEWVSWAAFAVDYIVNLLLAGPRRWRWFYTHLLDLAIVALPILRPLRLVRLAAAFTVLQRRASTTLRGRVILFAGVAAALLLYVAALAELDAERVRGNIKTIGDALWWAIVTITTVGYGDVHPVTLVGKLVGVCVMLGGIALIGVVTATLASWIIERISAEEAAEERLITAVEFQELRDEIRALRSELRQAGTGGQPDADGP